MALLLKATYTAVDTPGTSNIIPGGAVSVEGANDTALRGALVTQLQARQAGHQGNANTLQAIIDAANQ